MTAMSAEHADMVDIAMNDAVDEPEVPIPMLANQNSFCILQIDSVQSADCLNSETDELLRG